MLIPTYPHHHNSNTTPAARWCAATDATPHSCASSQSGARRAADTGERAQVRHARRWRGRSVGADALARFVLSHSWPPTTAALIGIVASPRHAEPPPGPTVDPDGSPGRGRHIGAALSCDSRPSPQPAVKNEFRRRGARDAWPAQRGGIIRRER